MKWECTVWSNVCGWDAYLVNASNQEEARRKCQTRLEEETDYPDSWKILEVVKVGD